MTAVPAFERAYTLPPTQVRRRCACLVPSHARRHATHVENAWVAAGLAAIALGAVPISTATTRGDQYLLCEDMEDVPLWHVLLYLATLLVYHYKQYLDSERLRDLTSADRR